MSKARWVVAAIATSVTVAAAFVKPHEGTRYTAYRDPIGIWTICEGHTRGVREGMTATSSQCDEWLRQDLLEANEIVDRCITSPMTINQRAALISFAFNVGAGGKGIKDGLCWLKSGNQPQIRIRANASDWQGACNSLMSWNKAGGIVFPGLVKRREAERALCLSDYRDQRRDRQ